MTTADDYINSVLDMMPQSTPMRSQIAMELRAHIAERLAEGHSLDDVMRQLGDPATLADSYLAADTLVAPSFENRAAAKFVDVLLVLVVVAPVAWLMSRQVPPEQATRTLALVTALCGCALLGLYSAITEFEYGQTLGKRLFGLRVVSESGRRICPGQAAVRQVSLIFSYSVDLIFVFFTDKQQRAFEMLSKTRVVQAVLVALLLLSAATPLRAQSTADPTGHWDGSVQIPGMELPFAVDLVKNSKGELAGTIDLPMDGLKGLPLSRIVMDGRSIHFVLRVTSGGGPFDGTLSADGSSIAGVFTTRGFSIPFSMAWTGDAKIEPTPTSPPIGKELEGTWIGSLQEQARQVPLILTMANQPDGTATGSLDGDGLVIPITMTQHGTSVTFAAKAVGASYAGVLNAAGTELVGTFTEGSLALPLTFRRTTPAEDKK